MEKTFLYDTGSIMLFAA